MDRYRQLSLSSCPDELSTHRDKNKKSLCRAQRKIIYVMQVAIPPRQPNTFKNSSRHTVDVSDDMVLRSPGTKHLKDSGGWIWLPPRTTVCAWLARISLLDNNRCTSQMTIFTWAHDREMSPPAELAHIAQYEDDSRLVKRRGRVSPFRCEDFPGAGVRFPSGHDLPPFFLFISGSIFLAEHTQQREV